jgi:hypothetical protein
MPVQMAVAALSVLERHVLQAHLIQILHEAPVAESCGASASFLLHVADTQPEVLRRVLHHRVEKGGTACRIIDVLNRT